MQKIIFIALILVVAVLAQTKQDKPEYKKPAITAKTCPRSLDVNFSNGKKTVVITANANTCASTDKRRMEKVQFSFSSVGIPRVSLNAQKKKEDSGAAIKLGFGIDRIIEYYEKNGVEGFQQGEDVITGTYKLQSPAWTDIATTTTDVDASTRVYDLSTSLLSQSFVEEVKFTVSVTPSEVSFRMQNTTVQRAVLTPNSFKVSLSVTNFKYANASSTGLAIGAVLASRGNVNKRASSRSAMAIAQSSTEVTTDTPSTNQEVHDIDDETDATTKTAYFSFQNIIFKYSASGAVIGTTKVVSSKAFVPVTDATEKSDNSGMQGDVGSDYNLRRMWFTPIDTAGRVTNFAWDPAVGTQESSATVARVSFIVLIASFIFALLF